MFLGQAIYVLEPLQLRLSIFYKINSLDPLSTKFGMISIPISSIGVDPQLETEWR